MKQKMPRTVERMMAACGFKKTGKNQFRSGMTCARYPEPVETILVEGGRWKLLRAEAVFNLGTAPEMRVALQISRRLRPEKNGGTG